MQVSPLSTDVTPNSCHANGRRENNITDDWDEFASDEIIDLDNVEDMQVSAGDPS